MTKLIAWNLAQREAAWRTLVSSDADIALVQEAKEPPADVAERIRVNSAPWQTGAHRSWRTAIVGLSKSAGIDWLETKALNDAIAGEFAVSRSGTLSAAIITPLSGDTFVAVSVYGAWEETHELAKKNFIYADASVHRLISDLSIFASKRSRQQILIAGDLKISKLRSDCADSVSAIAPTEVSAWLLPQLLCLARCPRFFASFLCHHEDWDNAFCPREG